MHTALQQRYPDQGLCNAAKADRRVYPVKQMNNLHLLNLVLQCGANHSALRVIAVTLQQQ